MAIDVNISGLNTVVDVEMAETALIDTESGQVIVIEDYNNLEHIPSINGVTLLGNKTSSDLGVASASHTHTVSDVTDFPSLATVATTGDYDDLLNKPTIPDAVTVTQITSTGTNIADIDIGGVTTHLYAPSGGGGGGTTAFVAEFNVTPYADIKDAYDDDAIIICTADDSGNTIILQLAYYDDANSIFYFAEPNGDGWIWTSIASDDTWDDGVMQFASTDTATQLRDGLMTALDKQKLDGIASGAEVNVQSDWNQSTNTADDYIKNKPTKLSQFNNDSGFITGYTETDPIFLASAAHGISSSDISNWNGKSDFSGSYNDLTDKPTIPTVNNATLTIQKNGTNVQTFTANASSNVTANITVPTKTSDLNNDSGFITGYTETDPVFSASAASGITSSNISTWNGKYAKPSTGIPKTDLASAVQTSLGLADTALQSFTETDPVFSASAASGITPSDISDWNSKSEVSVTRHTTTGTNIADLTIDGTTTKLYAPTGGGGGSVTDVWQNGSSVLDGTVGKVKATLVQIVRW